MKKFIDLFIKILIYIIIFSILIFAYFAIYYIFFFKENDTNISDTASYIYSIGNEIKNSASNNKKDVINISNIFNSSTNTNVQNIKNNQKNYYYEQLDNTSKQIYDSLENNIQNLKKDKFTIDFSSKFNDLLHESNGQDILNTSFQTAIDAFFYDHPELFYVDLSKISLIIEYKTIAFNTTYTVSLAPNDDKNYLQDDFKNEQQANEAIDKIENIKNNIVKNISSYDSDYNKALKVHDILVNSLKYDSSDTNKHTHDIYGSLIEQKAVCEGYAKSFKYILDSLNVECILVSGTATNSNGETESHMWNYIKLDGNWYGVDVTWDDPVIVGNYTKNVVRHDYFCKGSNIFGDSHIISRYISDGGNAFTIPTLSIQNYN